MPKSDFYVPHPLDRIDRTKPPNYGICFGSDEDSIPKENETYDQWRYRVHPKHLTRSEIRVIEEEIARNE